MELLLGRRGRFWVGAAVFAVLATTARGQAARPPASAAPAYAPAKSCALCHKTIHLYWSESAHARSASRPSFLAALAAVTPGTADKDAVRRGCLSCHAPTTLVTGDHALQDPVSREGVTCDFCHTVQDVAMDSPDRFRPKPGRVKYGPLRYAKSSPAHDSEYSVLHKSSPLLCAACHEHKNAQGVAVLSTYSEWQKSPYAERGMTCQECHMPQVPGTPVQAGTASDQRVINLHRMSGGSLPAKVQHGVELKIESVQAGSESSDVQVVVTNSGVGHALPGGLSTNALVLAVSVESASKQLSNTREKVYRRRLVDAQGRALAEPSEQFLNAAFVAEDSRIMPKESRSERFTLPIAPGASAILVRLQYRDESDPQAGPKTTLVQEERWPLRGR